MSDLTRRRFLGAAGAAVGGAVILGAGGAALRGDDPRAQSLRDQPPSPAARPGMNVVLIALDTVRADHVGAYRHDAVRPARAVHTPTFDELARHGLRFAHAHAEAMPTIPTRRGVFSGRRTFPMDHWKPETDSPHLPGWQRIPANQRIVAETLKGAGYRTAMVSDNTWELKHSWAPFRERWDEFVDIQGQEHQGLRAGRSTRGIPIERHMPKGLRRTDREKVETYRGVVARYLANQGPRRSEDDWSVAKVFRAAGDWLERNRDAQPFFLSIDSYDPHEPWDPPKRYVDRYDDPDYRGVEPIQPLYGGADYLTDRELRRMRALYAAELTLADHWMGVFLERLDSLGLADRTLVVVYSDHGHSLGERGLVGKQPDQLYAEMVDVPLIIRHPEKLAAGRTTGALAQLHDIPATILGAVGVPIPAAYEGIDLSPLLAGRAARERAIQTAAYSDWLWASDGRHVFLSSNRRGKAQLYDRVRDPHERRNLAGERRALADRFWNALKKDAGGSFPHY